LFWPYNSEQALEKHILVSSVLQQFQLPKSDRKLHEQLNHLPVSHAETLLSFFAQIGQGIQNNHSHHLNLYQGAS